MFCWPHYKFRELLQQRQSTTAAAAAAVAVSDDDLNMLDALRAAFKGFTCPEYLPTGRLEYLQSIVTGIQGLYARKVS